MGNLWGDFGGDLGGGELDECAICAIYVQSLSKRIGLVFTSFTFQVIPSPYMAVTPTNYRIKVSCKKTNKLIN